MNQPHFIHPIYGDDAAQILRDYGVPRWIRPLSEEAPDLCPLCGAYWRCDCLEARISLTAQGQHFVDRVRREMMQS